jgi:hypothetical protein
MSNTFDDILIHPLTKKQLAVFLNQPRHALLISGPAGSGKTLIATELSARLLSDSREVSKNPYFFFIAKAEDKSEISIDEVRQLIRDLGLRVPGNNSEKPAINRIAVIENAHFLSHEAQNAVLKLLEEPPAGTLIILTALSAYDLLPTVASRVQKINLVPISLPASLAFFDGRFPAAKIKTEWRLSQGMPGLMNALLTADQAHPLKIAVDKAKKLLAQTPYERIIFVREIAKNKQDLIVFIDALSKVLGALHDSAVRKGNRLSADKILRARQLVQHNRQSLEANANARLVGLSLAVNIPL